MRFIGFARIVAALATVLIFAVPASAQQANAVDCGNGYYCPADNACLMDGWCSKMVDVLPGSTQTSQGNWCEPALRESRTDRGKCIPFNYVDCPNGRSCPPGYQCSNEGTCTGGPPATGPMCGGAQCAAGRICSSQGACMNTEYFQDCGNGTICSKAAACEFPNGCVLVAPQRTRQIPIRR